MIDNPLYLIILYIIFELYEVSWQRADSMMGMLLRMHRYYRKSVLLFFIMHPTYYFIIYLMLSFEPSAALGAMLFIKTVDIAAKVLLIQQVFEKRRLSQEMTMMLLTPLHSWMPFIGLLVYPPFMIMAFYM